MKNSGRSLKLVIGICFFICIQNVNAQNIDANSINNLLIAKQNEGIEKFKDGRIKVQLNTKMIEQFYNYLSIPDNDTTSWNEILYTYRNDKESFITFWKNYNSQYSDNNIFEIDEKYKDNLEKARQCDGIERFADNAVKIQVNTKMIEQFYNSYTMQDYVSWNDILNSYRGDKENLLTQWNSFKKSEEETQYFADQEVIIHTENLKITTL